jgi:ATP-dependent Lon protease
VAFPDTIQIMKDFMANGRFSRGVEVIADASLAFIGNIDQSIEQIVNSTEHDLFLPLPPEFDLAIMDRFACYLPGWEMPKNSSSSLTGRYGLITDFLAEAFHYQLKHSSRYEEVSRRVRFGKTVEGRDEKGIKKTLCALLKILHPVSEPSDEEFEEYVTYAVECRRRVKEQMNKRKPDDEFAKIDLSFFNTKGVETVVHCPETRNAAATLEPERRRLSMSGQTLVDTEFTSAPVSPTPPASGTQSPEIAETPLSEDHYTIQYGDTGHTYASVLGRYLAGAKTVRIEEPYVRASHQVANFVRFCETVVTAAPTVRKIHLITGYDAETDLSSIRDKLEELKQSLLEADVFLEIELNEKLHDREIKIDNGWTVKIGRGLDFYQKPEGWFSIGASDLGLRKCLETKVDIYRD